MHEKRKYESNASHRCIEFYFDENGMHPKWSSQSDRSEATKYIFSSTNLSPIWWIHLGIWLRAMLPSGRPPSGSRTNCDASYDWNLRDRGHCNRTSDILKLFHASPILCSFELFGNWGFYAILQFEWDANARARVCECACAWNLVWRIVGTNEKKFKNKCEKENGI